MKTASYSAVTQYIDAAVEVELALSQRRAPLVPPSEVVKLGDLAFTVKGGRDTQDAIDLLVDDAVTAAIGITPPSDPEKDAHVRAKLGDEMAEAMREYCTARAALVATQAERATTQSGERGLPPMTYAGIWEEGRAYTRGQCVTRNGTLFHCGSPSSAKPGESRDWQMVHKTFDRKAAR